MKLALFCAACAAGGQVWALSATCTTLRSVDALLFVDLQNCFMESRPLNASQQAYYEIPEAYYEAGALPGGRLAVSDTGNGGIVDVALPVDPDGARLDGRALGLGDTR